MATDHLAEAKSWAARSDEYSGMDQCAQAAIAHATIAIAEELTALRKSLPVDIDLHREEISHLVGEVRGISYRMSGPRP